MFDKTILIKSSPIFNNMDTVVIVVCVAAYVGLLAQTRVREDSIKWLTLALSTGGMVLALESGFTTSAVVILTVSQFVVWIYTAVSLLRAYGGET